MSLRRCYARQTQISEQPGAWCGSFLIDVKMPETNAHTISLPAVPHRNTINFE
jgi:hypothetical protein